ncbi:MAG: hypothetical protein WAM82_12270 [Thermoanaerobaculia bacterium]
MFSEKLVMDALDYARSEIEKYGLPTSLHFDLSLEKAQDLAQKLGADPNLVSVGVALMDIKLGEAFQQKRLAEHVQMGVQAAQDFLKPYGLDVKEIAKVINCIEAHHGAVPHSCLESKIVTNADCYRFIHPAGVLSYIGTLSKRNPDLRAVIEGAEGKLDEKWQLLTIDLCKTELGDVYLYFKEIFAVAKATEEQRLGAGTSK